MANEPRAAAPLGPHCREQRGRIDLEMVQRINCHVAGGSRLVYPVGVAEQQATDLTIGRGARFGEDRDERFS